VTEPIVAGLTMNTAAPDPLLSQSKVDEHLSRVGPYYVHTPFIRIRNGMDPHPEGSSFLASTSS
jgi:hypothetical protein